MKALAVYWTRASLLAARESGGKSQFYLRAEWITPRVNINPRLIIALNVVDTISLVTVFSRAVQSVAQQIPYLDYPDISLI